MHLSYQYKKKEKKANMGWGIALPLVYMREQVTKNKANSILSYIYNNLYVVSLH